MGSTYVSGHELDIDAYTKDWLGANGDRYDQEVLEVLEKDYGYKPRKNRYLNDGSSIYQF